MNIFEVRSKIGPQEARIAGPSENKEQSFLVRAKSGPAAIKHVSARFLYIKAKVADNMRVAELMGQGVKLEEVKEEEAGQ